MTAHAVGPDRIETLLRLLSARSDLTPDELSRVLGVSRRTVRRYLRDIAAAAAQGVPANYELGLVLNAKSPGRRTMADVTLKSAVERLLAHPAIRNDPDMIASLQEIASFSSRRAGKRTPE